jgi:hypothetical protein
MKIVNIIGGLGNQLFQYAFAVALKTYHPEEEVYIDTSHFHSLFFKKYKGRNLHCGYEMSKLLAKADIPEAKWYQIARVSSYIPNYLLSRFIRKYLPKRGCEYLEKGDYLYDPEALQQKGNLYYEGYWQVANYFIPIRKRIKEAFQFKPLDQLNLDFVVNMQREYSVSIHVRRGDYVKNKGFGGICNLGYYMNAIEYVMKHIEKPVFYVFSNDIEWCKDKLTPLMGNVKYEFINHNKGNDSYKDMELMSYCHVNIIANSSFSWWGAFLNHNEDALVVAPEKWNNFCPDGEIYLNSWIKLSKI